MKKVIVVGGVAGGMSCATRIKRLDSSIDVKVFEQDNDVSFANCGMPYFIGGVISDRQQLLVQTPESINQKYDIDVRTRHRVTAVDRDRKTVTVHDLDHDLHLTFEWDYLVLSPGAYPIKPPLPGIDRPDVFILKNLDDMDRIREATVRAKSAVVVGGGYIGIEVAENLRHAGIAVDLVERLDYLMPALDPEMTRVLLGELRMNRVRVHIKSEVTAFSDAGVHLAGGEIIPADFTVISVGVKPVSRLAIDAGLKCTPSGHIMVDEHMQTSDPAIFAVGDAVAVISRITGSFIANPLAGPANRQGRIAADNICGRASIYKCTQGTAIAKVFNVAAAGTGLNEKQLTAAGVKYHRAYVHPNQHPSYYPGATTLDIKLVFDDDGRILGAQVVGAEGADTVINSFAQAMRSGQTVFDLEELELAYCPAWGNAKHPVNMTGFVAANILRGDVEIIEPWEEADVWLDVREPDEGFSGDIPGSINIPMGEISSRLAEIPKDKMIGIYCAAGLRGYIVYRRLKQLGYNVKNLNGGFRTWNWFARPGDLDRPPAEIKAPKPGVVPGIAVFVAPADAMASPAKATCDKPDRFE
jgi:NADPH-dependent 2,4-dienoyl-CoA reductase/sulfur reductase-like enzyme/rhodanese-related sulfurtransferase